MHAAGLHHARAGQAGRSSDIKTSSHRGERLDGQLGTGNFDGILQLQHAASNQAVLQLMRQATAPTVRRHHGRYGFQIGDGLETSFSTDAWSRQGADLLGKNFSGATVKSIVDDALKDWDPKASVFTILSERLLGSSGNVGDTNTATIAVSAVFMNSPVGVNYTNLSRRGSTSSSSGQVTCRLERSITRSGRVEGPPARWHQNDDRRRRDPCGR
jgi:hypothetical protein